MTDTNRSARRVAVRAIHALKSPPPEGSEHYRSGWDAGLEAAMDAVREAFDQPDGMRQSAPTFVGGVRALHSKYADSEHCEQPAAGWVDA